MTTTPQLATEGAAGSLSGRAADHLWMHFTRHSTYESGAVPVIERGEGAYIWDDTGKRYLDGLSGLFVVQAGHGREELAEAAARQAARAGVLPDVVLRPPAGRSSWPSGWPTLAPGDLNRVFFTTGGGEAVESAWKVAKQYFKLIGKPIKHKVISRAVAYHGTTQGALSITGIPALKADVRAAGPRRVPGGQHQLLPGARARRRPRGASAAGRPTSIASAIENEGPDTVAAVFLEPVQNAGGCFPPPARVLRSGSARSATATTCCSSPTR